MSEEGIVITLERGAKLVTIDLGLDLSDHTHSSGDPTVLNKETIEGGTKVLVKEGVGLTTKEGTDLLIKTGAKVGTKGVLRAASVGGLVADGFQAGLEIAGTCKGGKMGEVLKTTGKVVGGAGNAAGGCCYWCSIGGSWWTTGCGSGCGHRCSSRGRAVGGG